MEDTLEKNTNPTELTRTISVIGRGYNCKIFDLISITMTVLSKFLVLSGKKLLAHSKVWEKPRFNLTILTVNENTL